MVQILIADEQAVVRRGLRFFLEGTADWVVCGEVSNGLRALEQARALRPDVVVLDLFLSELNGIEVTRALRAEQPNTEVLVFTSTSSEELAVEVLSAGARGYVLKSDPPENITAAVEALARHLPFFTAGLAQTVVARAALGGARRGGSLLTARERQIVQLVAQGCRTREIAARLGISNKTVETHRTAVMRKLHLASLADVVRYAIRNHLIQP
jgi:DNA-binding NarL/FixJ family response regulator